MENALIIVDGQDGSSIPARIARGMTPALFSVSKQAQRKFGEFFTAHIRNPNTRRADLIAVWRFADWCGHHGIPLARVEPMVVAAYVEELTGKLAPASVKQHLAAIRMLFDWLVVGQVLPFNPASSVRGPKHVVKNGKTPVLSAEEARGLLNRIDLSSLAGLRDRALTRATALRMIKRRVRQVGLPAEICAHSFRGTGITEYLRNGGDLEVAARIAGHESTRTTQLYNRVQEEISLDEIERIHI